MTKTKLFISAILFLVLMGCIPVSNGKRIRMYDNRGAYVGYSVETDCGIRYYDSRGKFIGKGVKY